jgi:drug/metabolite transporter (DMT)-like permease
LAYSERPLPQPEAFATSTVSPLACPGKTGLPKLSGSRWRFSRLGFSFKAILVKLAYAVPQAVPVDAVTLLALRMLFALPVFVWVALRTPANDAAAHPRASGWRSPRSACSATTARASSTSSACSYISAGLERLIIFTYPTLTLLIGVLFMGKAIRAREVGALLLSYAGIGLAFVHDLQFSAATRGWC